MEDVKCVNELKKNKHDRHDGWSVGLVRGANFDGEIFDALVCEGKKRYTRFEAAAKEARKVDRQLKQVGIEDVHALVLEVVDDSLVMSSAR